MPPNFKFTREEIISAALDLARRRTHPARPAA